MYVRFFFFNFGAVFALRSSSADAFDTQFIMSQEIACVCLQTADVMNLIQLLKNPQRPRGSDRRALFNRNLTKKRRVSHTNLFVWREVPAFIESMV